MKKLFESKGTRRLLSLALSAAMVLSLLPMPSIAAESDGLCEHHPEHTAECGYVAAVEGQPCTHEHTEACYTTQTACQHTHTPECYLDGTLPAEGEDKAAEACTHECTEESGCVTKVLGCQHTHDESCGYVEAVAGSPCTYKCEICAGEESKPTEPETTVTQPTETQPEKKVIADWEWVDDWEIIDPDSGDVLLPFASAENVAYFDDILELLPAAITVDGEELTLGDWTCEAYPVETGAYEGEYVFETTLPDGYTLPDGTNVLRLTVVLGDPEGEPVAMYGETPPTGTYTIDGASVTAYQLSSAAHLYWFAQQVNSGNNAINAVLTQDITVNSGVLNTDGTLKTGSFEEWTPIGAEDHVYVGSFDGKNHTISGLYVNDADASYIGLFGSLNNGAFVTRVKVADSYFSGSHNIGGICGYGSDCPISYCVSYATVCGSGAQNSSGEAKVGGICGDNGKLSYCENHGLVTGSGKRIGGISGSSATVSDCKNYGAVQGSGQHVGGIVGYSTESISYCVNYATVYRIGDQSSDEANVGGIVGYNTSTSTISNSENQGSVQGIGQYVGGICGRNNYGSVVSCKNYGAVQGSKDIVGGIVGWNTSSGSVTDCRNEGAVTGPKLVGGIVGYNYNSAQVSGCTNTGSVTESYGESSGSAFGGIVGQLDNSTVTGCNNSGAVRGNSSVGGIVGYVNESGTIENSNNSGSVTGCNSDGSMDGGNSNVGGICGNNIGGTVTGCENIGGAVSGYNNVGGIVGRSYKTSTISNCKNSGSVNGDSVVGGVCGFCLPLAGYTPITVTNCENSGDVTGRTIIGGVCGQHSLGTITHCVNTGSVTGTSQNVGGICGNVNSGYSLTISESYNTGSVDGSSSVGGICGYYKSTNTASIEKCYNSADVSGESTVGSICGYLQTSAVKDCYYLKGSYSAVGKGTAQDSVVDKTAAQFASGEVAYLLNGGNTDGTQVWYQNIDTDTRDTSPKFTGGTVYKTAEASECPGYTNIEAYTTTSRNHNIVSHICTVCGYRDQYPITVSGITAKDKTYDGGMSATLDCSKAVLTNTVTGQTVTGVSVSATGTFDKADAGARTVTICNLTLTGADAGKYYLAESGQQTETTASITAKDITVTITPSSITYGDGTAASPQFSGVVGEDDVEETLTYFGTANDGTNYNSTTAPSKAGTYTVTVSISNNNYRLTGNTTADFVIGKATVTTPTLTGVTYDGKEHSPSIPADALYHLSDDFSQKNADTYSLTLTLNNTDNYQWDEGNGETSFTIGKKPLTITAENKTVIFGDPAPEYTARYDGFVTGETAESLNCVPTFTCNYSVGTSVNQSGYPISVSNLELSNYEISYTPGTLTVNPKKLDDSNITLTVADENLVYTGSALTPDVSVVWGDKTLTKDTDFTVDYSNNVNAGSAPQVTVTGKGNYTGAKSKSFTIQPRAISEVAITVKDDGNLVYTGNQIAPTVTVTNGSFTITATDYTVSYENNVAAGNNTAKVVLTGKNNYTGTASKTFSINKAGSAVGTVPAAVSGLVYSGQPQTLVTAGSTSHGTMVYSLAENGTYTSDLPTGTNAGSYTVWYKVSGDDNHEDSTPASVSCSIAQKSLTVTAKDHTITYGEAPANDGVTYSGFVNEEDEHVLGGTLAYDYSYSQYGNVGSSYTITPKGLTADNYDITFEKGTLTVQQKEIGITWGETSLPYTGTAQAPTATATGLVNSDTCDITVTGQQTDVGENYTATATTLSSGNYKLPQNVTCTFSITKVAPTFTAPTGRTVVYTGGELELAEGAETSHGTMQYRLGEEGKWSTAVPKATDCGTYTVWYRVVGDNNHTDTEPASVTAKILPFAINQEPQDTTIDYGENTTLTFEATTALEGEVTYQWYLVTDSEDGYVELTGETENTLTLTKPNAGEYTYVCIVTCGDYSETSAEADVTVSAVSKDLPANLPNGELWVEGGEEPVSGGSIDLKSPSSFLMTSYTYKNGSSESTHDNYPTGMQVYSVETDDQGVKTVNLIADLGDLLQYSGCSIRITGKPGIRMITSLTKEAKAALKKGELAGYTLEEYGTVVAWSKELGSQPLTLSTGNSNYAYRKGVSDPVFANVGALTQYTNVLVWNELDDAKYAEDIVMRPYIILSKDGETVTLYGGTVSRSIGYVAQQNADTFPKGSAGYKYVHDIIDKVDNLNSSDESTTTAGGNGE